MNVSIEHIKNLPNMIPLDVNSYQGFLSVPFLKVEALTLFSL